MVRASSANMDICGSRLGSYRIVSLLGKGGIGTVYLAKNENNSSLEALKILLPEFTESPDMHERFEREIENCAILKHPNIVKLNDYGKSQGISYYAMEYCNGGSLKDLLRRGGGTIDPADACGIMMQVLDGLEYAHNVEVPHMKLPDRSWGKGNGLIHRDIKPENILLQVVESATDGAKAHTAKISDFGLAKSYRSAGLSGNTQTGSVGGSLSFISRQQLLNYKYSKPEVDVWSAAAVLYFMLTGKPPRKVEGEKNPFNAVLKNNTVPIREVNPSVPEGLATVIDRALDDSSSLYYRKASELKKDIRAVI
ncbi:MAG: serine/threonine-protein kinase [Victivallales bacterium]|jgi:serine/threonine protein kinase